MNNFNYALNEGDYSLPKALTWGNCRAHFKKAINAGDLDGRVIHVLIALAEFLPILGQLASLIELAVMEIFSKNVAVPYLPKDIKEMICSKLEDPRALVRTSHLWREAVNQFCLRRVTNIFGDIFDFKKRGAAYIFTDMWGPLTLVKGKSIPIVDSHMKASKPGLDLDLMLIHNYLKLESPYADPEVLKTMLLQYNSSFLGANYQEVLQAVACILRALRAENRLKEIQQDPWFSNLASGFILDGSRYPLGLLLKSYGFSVSTAISPADLNSNIDRCIRQADPGMSELYFGYFQHLSRLDCLDVKTYCNTDGFSLADLAMRYGQFELEEILLAKEVPHFKKEQIQKQLEEDFCKAFGLMLRWGVDSDTLLFVGGINLSFTWERLKNIVEHYKININGTVIDGYLLGSYISNYPLLNEDIENWIHQHNPLIADYIPKEKITPLYALCQTLSYCFQNELRHGELVNILLKIERVIALGCGLDVKIGSGKSPKNLLTEILSRPNEKQPPAEITEKIKSILANNPEDRTQSLPTDVAALICSKLKDPRDVIALAQTNSLWRKGVTRHCSRLIPNLFGNVFNLEKRTPVQVIVDLWGPIKLRSNRLATVFPKRVSLPSSIEMASVLTAIVEGTVEELRQKIATLKNPTELTMLEYGIKDYSSCPPNPLKLAVETCDIDKVRLLIDSGTPVGIGESGMIGEIFNAPLVEAGTRKQEAILRLLLENGASFGVKEDLRIVQPYQRADYIPQPILYPMLENIHMDENDEVGLRCAALALRSWRDEQGPKAIQSDPWFSKFASKCIISCSRYQIGKLLMSYGVVLGTIDTEQLHFNISKGILNANVGYIEHLSNMGFLNFQEYRNEEGFSLADIAVRYGKIELESYFVEKKGVLYFQRQKALEVLEKEVCQQFGALSPKCIHLKKIVQHYQLNIDGIHIDGNTALLTLCYQLSNQTLRFCPDFKEMLTILMYIETFIMPLGANLDIKNRLEKDTPRFILEGTKGIVSRYANTSNIIEKIDSILG